MLQTLSLNSLAELIDSAVPNTILRTTAMDLPEPQTVPQTLAQLHALATENQNFRSYIGMGYYNTHVPPVIQRNVLENPGWYTAYTPYQSEISQGRLEGLLNFQQMVMDLTGMELANASLLDEGTAAAEAMALCKRVNKKNRSTRFFVASDTHPQTIAVLQTRAEHFGFTLVIDDVDQLAGSNTFGALLQYPGSYGHIHDIEVLITQAHQQQTLVAVATDLMSLLLLKPPGECGADVVLGNSQRFGVPLGFGGPHAAFFATRNAFKRSTPGRIIGVSRDRCGKRGLRMAMQVREQHIRREKATSNICTAQALLAIMAGFFAVYHGADGLRTIAQRIHTLTHLLADGLKRFAIPIVNDTWFDTLTIEAGKQQTTMIERAQAKRINLRIIGNDRLGISLDETTTLNDVIDLWQVMSNQQISINDLPTSTVIPAHYQRRSAVLEHPVFQNYHAETDMLRYMRRLEVRDIALNHSMIPLGSCTMKLNATAEMMPLSWPQFTDIHPFVPRAQVTGYLTLFAQLETMLMTITGFDAISLQPNSGAQGEYAGLLAIKHYHQSRGETQRTICLIPSSAHGTNPASASMAGLQVIIVHCDSDGNVDLDDLRDKLAQHSQQVAAMMITYPSTHGVFEENIKTLCALVHEHGGQVYIDGANLNALVGIASLTDLGADVAHINLHKTFCIPHGGGGPGMGPIGVAEHLAPFLPNHSVQPIIGCDGNDTISAATWGSAAILPISWMYIRLMGANGLTQATQVAILNANYLAQRLKDYFPILYTGRNGFVAHECIIDIRPLQAKVGITEEDIAKRLIDYGFHAPTMSFPVAGTLMIEPTESESKAELDRFIEALISIRQEIADIESGVLDCEDNPLSNAPHTAEETTADHWPHSYSRERAVFPVKALRRDKYWPPVARVDNVHGDRNLFCGCPATESYSDK